MKGRSIVLLVVLFWTQGLADDLRAIWSWTEIGEATVCITTEPMTETEADLIVKPAVVGPNAGPGTIGVERAEWDKTKFILSIAVNGISTTQPFFVIKRAFYNLLVSAQEMNFHSIVTPPLALGEPSKLSTLATVTAMLEALHEFTLDGGFIEEITISFPNEAAYGEAEKALERFGEGLENKTTSLELKNVMKHIASVVQLRDALNAVGELAQPSEFTRWLSVRMTTGSGLARLMLGDLVSLALKKDLSWFEMRGLEPGAVLNGEFYMMKNGHIYVFLVGGHHIRVLDSMIDFNLTKIEKLAVVKGREVIAPEEISEVLAEIEEQSDDIELYYQTNDLIEGINRSRFSSLVSAIDLVAQKNALQGLNEGKKARAIRLLKSNHTVDFALKVVKK